MARSRSIATVQCHPDRPYFANGLCRQCYERQRVRPVLYKAKKKIYDAGYNTAHKTHLGECRRRRKIELQTWYQNYKKSLSCKCGEDHPACITFHHRNPDEKSRDVSRLVSENAGLQRVLREIAKCDPVCFNCHMKIEYDRRKK